MGPLGSRDHPVPVPGGQPARRVAWTTRVAAWFLLASFALAAFRAGLTVWRLVSGQLSLPASVSPGAVSKILILLPLGLLLASLAFSVAVLGREPRYWQRLEAAFKADDRPGAAWWRRRPAARQPVWVFRLLLISLGAIVMAGAVMVTLNRGGLGLRVLAWSLALAVWVALAGWWRPGPHASR